MALKEEYDNQVGSGNWEREENNNLWGNLIDHVWESMTLNIPALYIDMKKEMHSNN